MVTRSEVRSRIAAAITGTLGPSGWTESPLVFDAFPGDNRPLSHLAFAVGVGAAEPDEGTWSGRAPDGTRMTFLNTAVSVKFSRLIRPLEQVDSYDEALDDEELLQRTVLAVGQDPGLSVHFAGFDPPQVLDGELYVGRASFAVRHALTLA